MSKNRKKSAAGLIERGGAVDKLIFWVSSGLLVVVPITLSVSVNAIYALPKFVALLVGSSVLFLLLAFKLRESARRGIPRAHSLKSRSVVVVVFYFVPLTAATAFGSAPMTSLFGSNSNYMGLITRVCFLICFFALIVGIGRSEGRLRATLWAITATGLVVAAYGVAQSFGVDPFVPKSLYTFDSPEGPLIRVCSTLGHSDYLGNFLMYILPLAAALCFASRGRARIVSVTVCVLSIAAVAASGTRGAWVGLIAGVTTFVAIELKSGRALEPLKDKRTLRKVSGIASLVLIASVVLIALNPVSRSIVYRAELLVREGAASSGRLLLWRDSIKMIPRFAIVGSGPEGFRKAFLGYKSRQLALLSPTSNNESPHNSYLDAFISGGVVGGLLYLGIIMMAFRALIVARRLAASPELRVMITGLVASIAAVAVHNFFIFDQLSNGLYFFAFAALARAVSNVIDKQAHEAGHKHRASGAGQALKTEPAREAPLARPRKLKLDGFARAGLQALAGVSVVVALWYSAGLIEAEAAFKGLFALPTASAFNALVKKGEIVAASPLPTRAHDFLLARAFELYAKVLPENDTAQVREKALRLAISYTERSIPYTNTPDLNYTTLASLARAVGDVDKLRYAAEQAVTSDPNNYQTRWLMAEAYLAQGERAQASREAQVALELYPFSKEAASTLARARAPSDIFAAATTKARVRKTTIHPKRSVEALIEMGRAFEEAGLMEKARNKLLTAVRRADGQCADCHRELALVYERMGRYSEAIAEWERFIEQAPERASAEQIRERVEALQQKNRPGQ